MAFRLYNFIIVFFAFVILLIPMVILFLIVKLTSKGPAIHWSKRLGQNNKIFLMPKFRTMVIDAPQVATHLMENSQNYLTPIGSFLRKTSLDELPQLWSILVGDMNIVGPRPALFNQDDLKMLRVQKNIHKLVPGLTGWAQINGRDEIPIPKKVALDEYYLKNRSLFLDFKIIYLTIIKVLKRVDVSH